ncbi:MAG: hypothetical protein AAGL98_05575, partial [Planctomycetota bacterium]
RPGMRVWLNTRWVGDAGNASEAAPQAVLMTEQRAVGEPGTTQGKSGNANISGGTSGGTSGGGGGEFKLQWRAPADVARQITSGQADGRTLEVWFEAGDDRTEPQRIELVARPQLTELIAQISPPDYAAGLVAEQALTLHERTDRVVSLPALAGSRVRLTLGLNKALPDPAYQIATLLPGLSNHDTVSVSRPAADQVVIEFTLDQSLETPIALVDEHGLTDTAERTYRFEPTEDRPPRVTILQPSADVSVLATAVLPVESRAGDDVGVRRLWIDADHPVRDEASPEPTPTTTRLAEREGRRAELSTTATLDLSALALRPGDVVTLHARAKDVYEIAGVGRTPVDATPRRLRIIDAATLIAQARADLAGVRQQAVRLERQQDELNRRAQDAPATRAAEQQRITRGLETQARQLQTVRDRLELNRLDEPALDELITRAADLVDEAQQNSDAAQTQLNQAAEAAARARAALASADAAAGDQDPSESDSTAAAAEAQAQAAAAQARAAQDQEAVRQQAVAAMTLTQQAMAVLTSDGEGEIKANTAFIEGVRRFALSVTELDIDLIDRVNPFEATIAVLAKSMDAKTLLQVQAVINAKKDKLTYEDARALAERA